MPNENKDMIKEEILYHEPLYMIFEKMQLFYASLPPFCRYMIGFRVDENEQIAKGYLILRRRC